MKRRYLKMGLISISLLFLVNCGGGSDSSDNSSDNSSPEDSVTIAGTTIPLALNAEDEILSQKVIEWNDGDTATYHTVQIGDTIYAISRFYGVSIQDIATWNNLVPPYALSVGQQLRVSSSGDTVSYLENNKKVMTYSLAYGDYSSRSDMDGYWDVRDDSNELWVLFKDGELSRFEVTTDGNGYIQYITQVNSDARPTHLVGEPSPLLLEQVAQDTVEDNQAEDIVKESVTSEDLFGEWVTVFENIYGQEVAKVHVFTSSDSFYNGKERIYKSNLGTFVEDEVTNASWYLKSDGKTIPLDVWPEGEDYRIGYIWTVESLNTTIGEMTVTQYNYAFDSYDPLVLHKCGSPSADVEPFKQFCD